MKKLSKIFKNRYVLILAIFVAWMLFFDQNNIWWQLKLSGELEEARERQEFYSSDYEKDSILLYQLENDEEIMEKMARENYLMKKDDETIFLIIDDEDNN